MRPEDLSGSAASAYSVWRWMGVSEQAAMDLLAQDGLISVSESDRAVSVFRKAFGMSEGAARIAARGRDGSPLRSVSEATSDSFETRLRQAQEALDAMSDAEVDTMYLEEQARRRKRKPAASKAAAAKSGGTSSAVVSEWGR